MGGRITEDIGILLARHDALSRNTDTARMVTVDTPDPYLNAAVTMMAFPTEGLWADVVYAHGACAWRHGYLGWRSCYGPICYGWTDRVRESILNHARLGLIKQGPDAGAVTCRTRVARQCLLQHE